ncbi:MAG: hypothetical protein LC118_08630 [Dehalococcoidia bacterium]|nr:hypothetical protein [Dehalococcoidia bacterium]
MTLLTVSAGGFSATVDGCARSEQELWFLSMLGHQQSVRAIWARMVKGERGFLSGDGDAKSLPLAREAGGTWRFNGMRLPSGASYHGMLVPELAVYNSDRSEFVLLVREQDDPARLHFRFLNRRRELPLHASWAPWLWDRGLTAGEVEELEAIGLHAYRCRPNVVALRDDIGAAVRQGTLWVDASVSEPLDQAA